MISTFVSRDVFIYVSLSINVWEHSVWKFTGTECNPITHKIHKIVTHKIKIVFNYSVDTTQYEYNKDIFDLVLSILSKF